MSRRASQPGVEALPDMIELVIVAVRAGLTPTAAIAATRPHIPSALDPALDEVLHRLERGARLADALTALPDLLGPNAATFADTLGTADRYGLPLAPMLDRLATEARTERRRHSERYARTLPVRLSFPLVVCTLPSFVLLAVVPALLGAISTLRDATP